MLIKEKDFCCQCPTSSEMIPRVCSGTHSNTPSESRQTVIQRHCTTFLNHTYTQPKLKNRPFILSNMKYNNLIINQQARTRCFFLVGRCIVHKSSYLTECCSFDDCVSLSVIRNFRLISDGYIWLDLDFLQCTETAVAFTDLNSPPVY